MTQEFAIDDEWSSFFDDLLVQIEAGDVVPIVGPEIVECDFGDGRIARVDEWLAEQLVEHYKIPRDDLPDELTLNDVGAWVNRNRSRDYSALYARVHALLGKLPEEPPEALLELAAIRDFPFYVTTTVDPLLDRALRDPRSGRTDVRAPVSFTTTGQTGPWDIDLPRGAAFVYHLFGRTSNKPSFVLSDEDKLEWLLAMQRHATEPSQLLDVLSRKHLLFLGTDLPDWLSRLILRTTKRSRLSLSRTEGEILAGRTMRDAPLTGFLSAFSEPTRVYPGSPRAFVREIYRRWTANAGSAVRAPEESPVGVSSAIARAARVGAREQVFISYRTEDREVALQVRDILERNGIDVWMDNFDLALGDDWKRSIETTIRECMLFLPLITPDALMEDESFLRREWRLASDRVKNMSEGRPFIIPLYRGSVGSPEKADVPDEFKAKQWMGFHSPADAQSVAQAVIRAVHDVRDRRAKYA